MKALTTAPGNTAIVSDIVVPEPSANEIRVKVKCVALNPVDALYVAHPADKPGRVVGSDISGTVDKIGENVKEWKVGDRVAGYLQGATSENSRPGGFAEYAILESDLTIRIPSGVSFEEAATFPLCSLTAAQALIIRLGINAPFPCSFKFDPPTIDSPALLIYSAATSFGLFAVELAKLLRTPSGKPYRIFATASAKNHSKLLQMGVDAVFDYRSATWEEKVRKASGGISMPLIGGGKIAVVRKAAWTKEGVRADVTPLYGAVWLGLGHEIIYNGEIMPASPSWRAFTVDFYRFLSNGSPEDPTRFPIAGNPVRLMPGGLENIVTDAFTLIGSGKVVDRAVNEKDHGNKSWMKPISAEKLVYRLS